MSKKKYSHLADLGVYGFDKIEQIVLVALVTEDPLLLIGASGTGKTYLLNSLSEAMALEHRHYNASLISFDDLVGFPYPDQENSGVKFLETPATVWSAESVLIDEISRCKPEHQNRLFSLVHERRIQGIALPKLRFRWAAMNPCSADQGGMDDYTGSEPLDPALADRFSLFVEVLDWDEMGDADKMKIADPSGEGKIADDGGRLKLQIAAWRKVFLERIEVCPESILTYVTSAVTALNGAGIRVSPRRSRLLARSLVAAVIVSGKESDKLFLSVLKSSLPHKTWGAEISKETVSAAHRLAWDSGFSSGERWIHQFHAEKSLAKKLGILIDNCSNPDRGTEAVAQMLSSEPKVRSAAFAFAVYPAAAAGKLNIGAEGANDLGKIATPILSVDGEISWQERQAQSGTKHPDFDRFARVLSILDQKSGRFERAQQFFDWCLVERVNLEDPIGIEEEINACVTLLGKKVFA